MSSKSFKWIKKGLVFDPKNHETPEWMSEFAQAPATLIFSDFIRVYFSTRPKPDENKQYVSYSGYVDLDKENLFKVLAISREPILKLGNLGEFDEYGTYPVSPIRKENEILLFYAGWTRCVSVPFNVGIGCALSNNQGKQFAKLGNGPIIPYTPNEPFVLSGPKIRKFNNIYYLFYIAGTEWISHDNRSEPIYKITMATSKDGLKWEKLNRFLIEDKYSPGDEAQASPDVFFKNGKYHMFFCYRKTRDYRNTQNGYRIGYAWSLDLKTWKRDDDKAGISISESGWDSEMVSYPHVFELNQKIYMMYLGNSVGKTGFGLAELNGEL